MMTIDDNIRHEKLQYNINREAAKISALLSGKIDKYKYLTSKEILSPNQSTVIEQPKFTYSPPEKAFYYFVAMFLSFAFFSWNTITLHLNNKMSNFTYRTWSSSLTIKTAYDFLC